MPHSRLGLEAHSLVGLTKEFPSFGMAKLDNIKIAIGEHARRNLTRPGTGLVPMHIWAPTLTEVPPRCALTSRTAVKGGITKR